MTYAEKIYFWARVQKTPTCWLWTGSTIDGYGYLRINTKPLKAHRVAWFLKYGYWPEESHHVCEQRRCIRPHPEHVIELTLKEHRIHHAAQVRKITR